MLRSPLLVSKEKYTDRTGQDRTGFHRTEMANRPSVRPGSCVGMHVSTQYFSIRFPARESVSRKMKTPKAVIGKEK